jgi:hypothetical protein
MYGTRPAGTRQQAKCTHSPTRGQERKASHCRVPPLNESLTPPPRPRLLRRPSAGRRPRAASSTRAGVSGPAGSKARSVTPAGGASTYGHPGARPLRKGTARAGSGRARRGREASRHRTAAFARRGLTCCPAAPRRCAPRPSACISPLCAPRAPAAQSVAGVRASACTQPRRAAPRVGSPCSCCVCTRGPKARFATRTRSSAPAAGAERVPRAGRGLYAMRRFEKCNHSCGGRAWRSQPRGGRGGARGGRRGGGWQAGHRRPVPADPPGPCSSGPGNGVLPWRPGSFHPAPRGAAAYTAFTAAFGHAAWGRQRRRAGCARRCSGAARAVSPKVLQARPTHAGRGPTGGVGQKATEQ